jgi:hypothetical protein
MLHVGSPQHWQLWQLVCQEVDGHQRHQEDAEQQARSAMAMTEQVSITMVSCLMVDITSSRQGVQVGLSISEVLKHVGPSFVKGWTTIPETKILLENGFLVGKEDIGHIKQPFADW